MQAFSLDTESGIPVRLQLKAHIRYQALAGILRPGDQLPPLRDLAAGLGVNLNTVVRAVDDLTAEGFLYSHQGRGVFVAEEFPGQGRGAALRSLLAGVLGPSREWGMSAEDMALALIAHSQLARPPKAATHRLLLVGGSRPQLRRLQGELEGALPVVVEAALAEEVPDRLRVADFQVVAVTLFHEVDVTRLLPRATIVTLAGRTAREALAAIPCQEAGAVVAVASRDWLHAARVRRSLEYLLPTHLQVEIAAGQTPAALTPVLSRSRFVLATPDCREMAREAMGARPDVTLLTEPLDVPDEALEAIRRALGVPQAEQRVGLRSAWV